MRITMQAFHFDTVESTNLEAKRLVAEGRITGTALVTAREQTAGRGSRGRSWVSPRDAGIYLSVVDVRGGDPVVDLTLFTLAAGVACVEVLRETTGVDVGIKPVNDLYVEGCKLGGILTEAVLEQQTVRAVVTGVGVNVRSVSRPVGVGAAEPVALQALMPAPAFAHVNLGSIAERLARRVVAWNQLVWTSDVERIRAAWEEHAV